MRPMGIEEDRRPAYIRIPVSFRVLMPLSSGIHELVSPSDSAALGALVSVVPERPRHLLAALEARELYHVAFLDLLHGT